MHLPIYGIFDFCNCSQNYGTPQHTCGGPTTVATHNSTITVPAKKNLLMEVEIFLCVVFYVYVFLFFFFFFRFKKKKFKKKLIQR